MCTSLPFITVFVVTLYTWAVNSRCQKCPDVVTTVLHYILKWRHILCPSLSNLLQLSIPMKKSSLFINFLPVLKLHISRRKEEEERKLKLSRNVLSASLNADVDLFVLLRNLHLWPGRSLHVYLKSRQTEKDTAIMLKSESLLGWLVLHLNHFSDLSFQAKQTISMPMGSWWRHGTSSGVSPFRAYVLPQDNNTCLWWEWQYFRVVSISVSLQVSHFFPRYLLDIQIQAFGCMLMKAQGLLTSGCRFDFQPSLTVA